MSSQVCEQRGSACRAGVCLATKDVEVSAQEIPFATETWRGVVCWRGGWFRGWRGGGWWCCGGGVGRWRREWVRVEVVGGDGVQGGGLAVLAASGQAGYERVRCGGVSWRGLKESESTAKAHSSGAMSSLSPPPPPLVLAYLLAKGALGEAASRLLSSRKRMRNGCPTCRPPPNSHAT